MNQYDEKYNQEEYYWGIKPSPMCLKVLELFPPDKYTRLLDIGCGEGRNAVFFARNGYQVTAFDLSKKGVEKTQKLAEKIGVSLKVFQVNINDYRLSENYDILFSSGTLHYVPSSQREEIFDNYKKHTSQNGIHVFSVFVKKPFIIKAPDSESNAHKWISGVINLLP